MSEFDECVRSGKLVQFKASEGILRKEMEGSEYDLKRAHDSFSIKDYKWASIQAYYSMFHCAKALLLRKGYREKSHYCVIIGLKHLYVERGEMDPSMVVDLEDSMLVRHEADYGLTYKESTAELMIEKAGEFLRNSKPILEQ